jgi:probable FeS assembly SUF system protein SufT
MGSFPHYEPVTLERDCEAVLIPAGDPITLPAGSVVFITQNLGGSCTVNVNGNLARVAGKDLDALGLEPVLEEAKPKTADGPVDEDLLWEQLATCFDPEIPINVVELGLVYDLQVVPENGGNRVDVKMTLTAPGCGMGAVLVDDVKAKLERVPNVTEANVLLTFDPPWSMDMMSDAARLQTGMY